MPSVVKCPARVAESRRPRASPPKALEAPACRLRVSGRGAAHQGYDSTSALRVALDVGEASRRWGATHRGPGLGNCRESFRIGPSQQQSFSTMNKVEVHLSVQCCGRRRVCA